MRITNGQYTTLVSFSSDYTEATLSRAYGIVHKVFIKSEHFSMQKLEQISNLDDDSFIGLSKIQAKRKELEN